MFYLNTHTIHTPPPTPSTYNAIELLEYLGVFTSSDFTSSQKIQSLLVSGVSAVRVFIYIYKNIKQISSAPEAMELCLFPAPFTVTPPHIRTQVFNLQVHSCPTNESHCFYMCETSTPFAFTSFSLGLKSFFS